MRREGRNPLRAVEILFYFLRPSGTEERKSTRRLGVKSERFRGREIWWRGDGGKVCFVVDFCRRRNFAMSRETRRPFYHNSEKRGRGKSSGFVVEYSSPQNYVSFDDFSDAMKMEIGQEWSHLECIYGCFKSVNVAAACTRGLWSGIRTHTTDTKCRT